VNVFVAGATGAIGRPLVRLLVEAGHAVTGMTRSEARAAALGEQGAAGVVADAFDPDPVHAAVMAARPDAVIHQLTDIPPAIDPRKYEAQMATNDRLRVEGTRNLVAAARAAGAERIVAQSIAFAYRPTGTALWSENDRLYTDASAGFRRSVAALESLEEQIATAGGVTLRYGFLYGPGTAYTTEGPTADMVRRRRLPVVGTSGVWSLVHVEDAARAAVAALDPDVAPGVYNVVDDDPAPVPEWIPAYAEALGAPAPRRVPPWVARLAAGRIGVHTMAGMQGASNAKARAALGGWAPTHPTWREGFRTAL